MTAAAALVPPWLEQLLTTPFFSTCRAHGDGARSECNMFCLDCHDTAAFCFYCRSSSHSDHRTIQIRRSSYHDVVRVSEIQKVLDIGGVQTYVINSARVLFLNERPQPRGGSAAPSASSAATSATGKAVGGIHICEICSRTLLDPFRFCSLGCKLERIKRNGDTCFVLDDDNGDGDDDDQEGITKASTVAGDGRRRRRRRGGVGGKMIAVGEMLTATSTSVTTPPLTAGTGPARRRKGVPQRAPLGS